MTLSAKNTKAQSEFHTENIRIYHRDCRTALQELDSDSIDFILTDPPYYSATKSKLYGKKGDLHTSFNHKKLCDRLKKIKHKFLLTYDDSPYIRELYKDFYLCEYSGSHDMNNYKQAQAAKGTELLISNYNYMIES